MAAGGVVTSVLKHLASRYIYLFHFKIMLLFVIGDITQKGYEKKRTRLLTPYIPQQQPQGKFNFLTLP